MSLHETLNFIRIKLKAVIVILMCLASIFFLPLVFFYEFVDNIDSWKIKNVLREPYGLLLDMGNQIKVTFMNGIIYNKDEGF